MKEQMIQALDLMFRKLPLDNGQAMQRLLDDVNKVVEEMKGEDDVVASMAEKQKLKLQNCQK